MNNIYTIGHSNHDIEAFLGLLSQHGIDALADVRSQPASRRFAQFGSAELRSSLKAADIAYVFLGKELGARSDDPACWRDGQPDYELIAASPRFRTGLGRLMEGAARHRIALLCAERDPLDCHRALLVGRAVFAAGVQVTHILADGALETHQNMEARLREAAGLPAMDLFGDQPDALDAAYRHRALKLARHPGVLPPGKDRQ